MRTTTLAVLASVLSGLALSAQDSRAQSPARAAEPPVQETKTSVQESRTDDQKMAEIKALIARARARQRATDSRNTQVWARWNYAVCLGCGWAPKGVRVVHTHPLRVLAGIIAADDDARELAGKPL